MSEIIFRPALPDDARAMSQLFLARFQDSMPGYTEWLQQRSHWWEQHGEATFGHRIKNSVLRPARYFSQVAIASETGQLVGSTMAGIAHDDTHCVWQGLRVAASHEGHGIGAQLEARRQAWAAEQGRPARVQVVDSNLRAQALFERSGFKRIQEIKPSSELPLLRYEYELGTAALALAYPRPTK